MEVMRVRRVGRSNVVSLPRALEALGYRPGTFVAIDEQKDGSLVLRSVQSVRGAVEAITPQVIDENRQALDMLMAYDRGELTEVTPGERRTG